MGSTSLALAGPHPRQWVCFWGSPCLSRYHSALSPTPAGPWGFCPLSPQCSPPRAPLLHPALPSLGCASSHSPLRLFLLLFSGCFSSHYQFEEQVRNDTTWLHSLFINNHRNIEMWFQCFWDVPGFPTLNYITVRCLVGTNKPGLPQEVRNSTRKTHKILSNSPTTCFLKNHLAYEQWLRVGEYVVWVSTSGEKQSNYLGCHLWAPSWQKKPCWYQPGTCQAVCPSTADAHWCISCRAVPCLLGFAVAEPLWQGQLSSLFSVPPKDCFSWKCPSHGWKSGSAPGSTLQQVLSTLLGHFCSQYLGVHLHFPAYEAIEKITTWKSKQTYSLAETWHL